MGGFWPSHEWTRAPESVGRCGDEQAHARIIFHVRRMFAQSADMDIKGREIFGKTVRYHREIWFPLMQCAKRGDACLTDEAGKGLF